MIDAVGGGINAICWSNSYEGIAFFPEFMIATFLNGVIWLFINYTIDSSDSKITTTNFDTFFFDTIMQQGLSNSTVPAKVQEKAKKKAK